MKRLLFLILSALLTALFVCTFVSDSTREWTRYQRRFLQTLSRDERRGITGGIKQILATDLHRVDRCTTCHLAIDKPQLALAEEPFTSHPGQYLQWHPVETFGCTVCHGGQGLATEAAAAHGDVPHWEQPLLRGPLVQASCRSCHGTAWQIAEQAPWLLEGRALFQAKGCYGCHALKDFGQSVSVDLTQVGSKSYLLMEADFEMMAPPHDRIHWLERKLRNPRTLNPGVRLEQLPPGEEEVFPTPMPHFGLTEHEVQALTTYLLSLSDVDPPASYVIPEPPESVPAYASPVERGQAVFEKYGCTACHGIGGVGGRKNWNGGLGEEAPPLLHVKAYYGDHVEELKTLLRTGRQPVPRVNAQRPEPALYMPAWKDRISEEDLDALIAYLFSLANRLPRPAAAPAPQAETSTTAPPAVN